jgi:V8-like Glu-specific endopeptidase
MSQWKKYFSEERAKRAPRPFEITLASVQLDAATARSVKLKRKNGRVELLAKTRTFSSKFVTPKVKTVDARRLRRNPEFRELEGFRPAHLDFRALPQELVASLRQTNRIRHAGIKVRRNTSTPTSVFAPEDRFTFNDTAFPWSTCGRVDTAAGWGSGVMIGPRHFMTASHVVNWGPNNTAGWIKFTPLQFDDTTPFGTAFATRIYSWLKADGSDQLDRDETAFDYVVCVLERRLGEVTGWMGSRGYSTDWDGDAVWGHIGYPFDLAGGKRPAFVGYQAFDSTFTRTVGGRDSFGIQHRIDAVGGQSGGPYFGWWGDEPWPRVVGTQSGENQGGPGGPNNCGGGNPLPELINHARTVEP